MVGLGVCCGAAVVRSTTRLSSALGALGISSFVAGSFSSSLGTCFSASLGSCFSSSLGSCFSTLSTGGTFSTPFSVSFNASFSAALAFFFSSGSLSLGSAPTMNRVDFSSTFSSCFFSPSLSFSFFSSVFLTTPLTLSLSFCNNRLRRRTGAVVVDSLVFSAPLSHTRRPCLASCPCLA